MTITIFGIKNCSSMKKAFDWLDERGVAYRFHDYKKSAIDADTLGRWCARVGRDALINTRGTTWRKLPENRRMITSDTAAIALMSEQPSLIRRPVIELADGSLLLGFDPTRFEAALAPTGDRA